MDSKCKGDKRKKEKESGREEEIDLKRETWGREEERKLWRERKVEKKQEKNVFFGKSNLCEGEKVGAHQHMYHTNLRPESRDLPFQHSGQRPMSVNP